MSTESSASQALILRLPDPEAFSPSAKQQQEISLFIKNVCLNPRKGNPPWTPQNIELAARVLLQDALPRGLAAQNRPFSSLKPDESLKNLILKGVENRNLVRKTMQEIFDKTERAARGTGSHYAGPYAINKNLFIQAMEQVNAKDIKGHDLFPVTVDISKANRLAYTYSVRQQILPVFAQYALDSLDKTQFPTAISLESLKDLVNPSDQQKHQENMAKITRNILLALALGGTQAFIPIGILQTLSEIDVTNAFTEEKFSKIYQENFSDMFQESLETQEYLHDLYIQTQEELLLAINKRNQTNARTSLSLGEQRDNTYRAFTQSLFINQAATEERPINVDRSEHQEDSYSLWDTNNSRIIGNYRVPRIEALAVAHRQAIVAPNLSYERRHERGKRYTQGVNAWKNFEREQRQEAIDRESYTAEMEKAIADLSYLRSLPNLTPSQFREGLNLVRDKGQYKGDIDTYLHRVTNISRITQRLSQSSMYRATLDTFLSELRARNGGELPAEISFPEGIRELFREIDRHEKSVVRGHAQHLLDKNSDIVTTDFFSQLDHLTPFNEYPHQPIDLKYWKNLSRDDIKSIYEGLETALKKASESSSSTVTFNGSYLTGRYITYLQNELRPLERRLKLKGFLSENFQRKFDLYTRLEREAQIAQRRKTTTAEFPRDAYTESLSNRMRAITMILRARSRINQTKKPLNAIPEIVSAREALMWENELRAATLDPATTQEQLDDYLPDLAHLSSVTSLFSERVIDLLPTSLPDKKTLSAILEEIKIRLDQEQNDATSKFRRRGIRRRGIDLLLVTRLLNAVSTNPLFPETDGLTWKHLWVAMKSRIAIAKALQSRDKEIEDQGKAKIYLEEVAGTALRLRLENNIRNLQTKIQDIDQKPAQKRFLKEMNELGLCLGINSRRG